MCKETQRGSGNEKILKAFMLIEMIIIIVVIGIIAAVSMPKFGRNNLQNATSQLINHIRYTQHLAMQNDKFDPDDDWFLSYWQLSFDNSQPIYSIVSKGDSDLIAKNPNDISKVLSGSGANATVSLDLGKTYKVSSIQFTDGCANDRAIWFDEMGRPYSGVLDIANFSSPRQVRSATASGRIIDECKIVLYGYNTPICQDNFLTHFISIKHL